MPTSWSQYFFINIKNLYLRLKIPNTNGFTLIELLIVTSIIGILSTIVLANYNSFGGRQEVRDTADDFKSEMRKYQNFAISGHKNPDQSGDCDSGTLEAYSVSIDANGYDVSVVCPGGTTIAMPRVDFPTGIIGNPGCGSIRFFPVNEGAEVCGVSGVPTSVAISFTRDGTTYIVTVNESGEIRLHQ